MITEKDIIEVLDGYFYPDKIDIYLNGAVVTIRTSFREVPVMMVFNLARDKTVGPMELFSHRIVCANERYREKVEMLYYWDTDLIEEVGQLMIDKYKEYKEQEEINRQIIENDQILQKLKELKGKMKYKIKITETLEREVTVEASNRAEAIEKVDEAYRMEKIVLDSSDYVSYAVD